MDIRRRQIKLVHVMMYEITVRQAMTTDVVRFPPEASYRDVQRLMKERRVSGVPIVEADRLVGLVSIDDIISAFDHGYIDEPVGTRMTRKVVSVPQNYSVIAAANIFQRTRFGRLPVVDAPNSDRLVGILTYGDILSRLVLEINSIAERRDASQTEQADHPLHPERMHFELFADNYDLAGMASTGIKKQLKALGVDTAILRRIAVICYEAEMNVVIHSLGGFMDVDVRPEAVDITVVDEGPGIPDVERAMTMGYTTANEKIRAMGFGAGMGLCNIKRCADRFEIKSSMRKGTRLQATVFLRPPAEDRTEDTQTGPHSSTTPADAEPGDGASMEGESA